MGFIKAMLFSSLPFGVSALVLWKTPEQLWFAIIFALIGVVAFLIALPSDRPWDNPTEGPSHDDPLG